MVVYAFIFFPLLRRALSLRRAKRSRLQMPLDSLFLPFGAGGQKRGLGDWGGVSGGVSEQNGNC